MGCKACCVFQDPLSASVIVCNNESSGCCAVQALQLGPCPVCEWWMDACTCLQETFVGFSSQALSPSFIFKACMTLGPSLLCSYASADIWLCNVGADQELIG